MPELPHELHSSPPSSPIPWHPGSWRAKKALQQPQYEDPEKLSKVLDQLRNFPPLVFSGEVDNLKDQLALAARGERFLLQGGDCAERFQDCTPTMIMSKIKILLQMSVVLCYGARKPVIRVGRIAGQYAKPRSAATETVGGEEVLSFRGDSINSYEGTLEARTPNSERLNMAYHHASMTLNYIRALVTGGFADLHHPEKWDLGFMSRSGLQQRYQGILDHIQDAIHFMDSLGGLREEALSQVEFFTSHEGLHLGFEESMTRYDQERERYYNLGAHMLWIGDRTRDLSGAHVEYFRGIANPVGIKVGPNASPEEMVQVAETLNPDFEPGKIILITRYGANGIESQLPFLIKAFQKHPELYSSLVWSVDPMHGNMVKTKTGLKTRDFDAILSELKQAFEIHKTHGSHLAGVHFELTGENVTECTGGAEGLTVDDLSKRYSSFCDPRLNYSQSLEMAFLIASIMNPKLFKGDSHVR